MALATLCYEARSRDAEHAGASCKRAIDFTGFIVDHQLRSGSGDEARKVADELEKLNIRPKILRLNWSGHDDPSSRPNLESAARRLRYQALGRACRDASISSLLLGHHADDQAETTLMRIVSGYTGAGLAGMRASVPLPECNGIHGVDRSGRPPTWTKPIGVESGGIQVHRPLLHMRKEQLIDVCREHDTSWFEDDSNADVTLTLRNAVRSLLSQDDVLPHALSRTRLLDAASSRADKEVSNEAQATKALAGIPVSLDVRTGGVKFTMTPAVQEQMLQDDDTARRLLRRVLYTVSPKSNISLHHLDQALALVLSRADGTNPADPAYAHAAGVQVQRASAKNDDHNDASFTMFRALPSASEQSALTMLLWPHQTSSFGSETLHDQWRLWDGRYWIRVLPPDSGARNDWIIVAKMLNKDGLEKLRTMSKAGSSKAAQAIRRMQRAARHEVRLTLPAIFIRQSDDAGEEAEEGPTEEIVALPSLGWHATGWTDDPSSAVGRSNLWRYEIKYKHVELREDHVQEIQSKATFV